MLYLYAFAILLCFFKFNAILSQVGNISFVSDYLEIYVKIQSINQGLSFNNYFYSGVLVGLVKDYGAQLYTDLILTNPLFKSFLLLLKEIGFLLWLNFYYWVLVCFAVMSCVMDNGMAVEPDNSFLLVGKALFYIIYWFVYALSSAFLQKPFLFSEMSLRELWVDSEWIHMAYGTIAVPSRISSLISYVELGLLCLFFWLFCGQLLVNVCQIRSWHSVFHVISQKDAQWEGSLVSSTPTQYVTEYTRFTKILPRFRSHVLFNFTYFIEGQRLYLTPPYILSFALHPWYKQAVFYLTPPYNLINENKLRLSLLLIFSIFILYFMSSSNYGNLYLVAFDYAEGLADRPDYNRLSRNSTIIGFDGVSFLFLFLTLFIFSIVQFNLGSKKFTIYHYRFLLMLLAILEIQLVLTFLVQNLLVFYMLFESTLIPMFFIIGFFGTRARKVVAAFYLFLYTVCGSLFLLIGVLIIFLYTKTFFIPDIYQYTFSYETQLLLWLLFFFGFVVKLPSIPFHLWLPEAHVEAPAVGSIILAALLLKLGGYGLLRVSLKMFPDACLFFQPFVFTIAIISILYASLTAIRQTDIKRIIAYSSIAHMNFTLLGLFCFNKFGLVGAFYLMFGHGLVSGGLFLLIGLLYERYGTRSIFYYGGLAQTMPYFTVIFLVLTLANMGFPGLVNFLGEFLIMLGIIEENLLLFLLIAIGFVLSAVYSIWLFNRLLFGNVKYIYLQKFYDITPSEYSRHFVGVLLVSIFFFGLVGNVVIELLEPSLSYYLVDFYYSY